MGILTDVANKRHFAVPDDQALILSSGEKLFTLGELSQRIDFIAPGVLYSHVSEGKNDFADWIQTAFGEEVLASQLRAYPTPLRMMVSIEKFLRQSERTSSCEPQTSVQTWSEIDQIHIVPTARNDNISDAITCSRQGFGPNDFPPTANDLSPDALFGAESPISALDSAERERCDPDGGNPTNGHDPASTTV